MDLTTTNGHTNGYHVQQPNLLDPKSGAMVFDELSGRLVSVPIAAFAAAVASLITRELRPAAPPAAPPKARRTRTAQHVVPKAGAKLEHVQHGKVLAKCTYQGEGHWTYAGKTYSSPSAAANAAASDLKQKSATLNGWRFWGLLK